MTGIRTPLVTVALPVLNAKRTLALALGSIRSQTYSNWELIVVDDGSTDGTPEIIQAFAQADSRIVPIFHERKLGLAVRLNEIIRQARGQLLARMDSDDISYPDRLDRQVAFLLANPVVDLVGSSMTVFLDGSPVLRRWPAPPTHAAICRRPAVGFRLFHPTWMARTGWMSAHLYHKAAHRSEDQELLLRTYRQSVFANLERPLLGYREAPMKARAKLAGRFNYVRIGSRLMNEQGLSVTMGISWHLLKGAVDIAASGLGLEEAMSRHRGLALSTFERERWRMALAAATQALPVGIPAFDLGAAA